LAVALNYLRIMLKINMADTDRGSFDRKSVDRNCVLSVDQNFHNQLTEIFDTFQLIEKFDQLPKKN
jgi:hypothetical protein